MDSKLGYSIIFLVVVSFVAGKPAPPTTPGQDGGPLDTGLYYDQYLQKVVTLLESDENFKKTMETANFEDIRDGKLSGEIRKIPADIRRKLDEVKRDEMMRLRKISHAKMQLDKGQKIRSTNSLKDIANHLDPINPHTFEADDLTNLIKASAKDLENFDEERHKEFKNYEMNKDLRRQDKLRQMNEADREKAEKEYKEMRKKHEDHPAMNHPGSKAQMQEVWEEEDGLKDQEFNPKTFFSMHDINGDRFLDPMELEALFEKDLAKVYDPNNPEDDMIEKEEERRRMREHVMKEVDYNKDGLISYDEFIKYTGTTDFDKPDEDSYKTVDQMIDNDEIYSKDELEEFRVIIKQREDYLKAKLREFRDEAERVDKMKTDVHKQRLEIDHTASEEEKADLEDKKDELADSEKILKEMHAALKQQSKEIMEMKEDLKKQESKKRKDVADSNNKLHVYQQQAQPPAENMQQPQDGQQPQEGQQFQQT